MKEYSNAVTEFLAEITLPFSPSSNSFLEMHFSDLFDNGSGREMMERKGKHIDSLTWNIRSIKYAP